jgi:hypothetical protein|nr:MAG TPA: hypothetical protein [Caudoviricetes sp.]
MSFSLQKFFEFLAYIGGLAYFTNIFFETLDSRDRVLQALLLAILVIAFLSSFVREV